MTKKLIVFPVNIGNYHWACVFVFNPEYIESTSEDSPRTCFLRYCNLEPDGTREILHEIAILWFLNLAISYKEKIEKDKEGISDETDDDPLSFWTPFGIELKSKKMLGTKKFPAVVLDNWNDLIPHSMDFHTCGIGIVAMTGLLLHNLFGDSDKLKSFQDVFMRKNLTLIDQEREEERCLLNVPTLFSDKLSARLPEHKSFLVALKEEWFVFIDRLAELIHVTLPKKANPFFKVEPVFERFRKKLLEYGWPPIKVRVPSSAFDLLQSNLDFVKKAAEIERRVREKPDLPDSGVVVENKLKSLSINEPVVNSPEIDPRNVARKPSPRDDEWDDTSDEEYEEGASSTRRRKLKPRKRSIETMRKTPKTIGKSDKNSSDYVPPPPSRKKSTTRKTNSKKKSTSNENISPTSSQKVDHPSFLKKRGAGKSMTIVNAKKPSPRIQLTLSQFPEKKKKKSITEEYLDSSSGEDASDNEIDFNELDRDLYKNALTEKDEEEAAQATAEAARAAADYALNCAKSLHMEAWREANGSVFDGYKENEDAYLVQRVIDDGTAVDHRSESEHFKNWVAAKGLSFDGYQESLNAFFAQRALDNAAAVDVSASGEEFEGAVGDDGAAAPPLERPKRTNKWIQMDVNGRKVKAWSSRANPKSRTVKGNYFPFPDRLQFPPAEQDIVPYRVSPSFKVFQRFQNEWRKASEEDIEIAKNPPEKNKDAEKAFIAKSLKKWSWRTDLQHKEYLNELGRSCTRKMKTEKDPAKQKQIEQEYQNHIKHLKKERKRYKAVLKREWKFSVPSFLRGLRYDRETNQFWAKLIYMDTFDKLNQGDGIKEMIEEEYVVSEQWIRDADFDEDVIQHVINMSQDADGFTHIPERGQIAAQKRGDDYYPIRGKEAIYL